MTGAPENASKGRVRANRARYVRGRRRHACRGLSRSARLTLISLYARTHSTIPQMETPRGRYDVVSCGADPRPGPGSWSWTRGGRFTLVAAAWRLDSGAEAEAEAEQSRAEQSRTEQNRAAIAGPRARHSQSARSCCAAGSEPVAFWLLGWLLGWLSLPGRSRARGVDITGRAWRSRLSLCLFVFLFSCAQDHLCRRC